MKLSTNVWQDQLIFTAFFKQMPKVNLDLTIKQPWYGSLWSKLISKFKK